VYTVRILSTRPVYSLYITHTTEQIFSAMDVLEHYLTKQKLKPNDGSASRLLREVAYDRLKDAIRHANLQPGQPLSETRISKLLGISRTPVREALQQLAQEGLVHVIPGRAVTIAAHSVQEVLNVVHIRSILEPELVRLAAEAASSANIQKLSGAMQKMEEAVERDDQRGWSRADTIFHETLSLACPNKLLGEMVVQMRNRVHHLANVDSQTNPARLAACTEEHRRIVNAIAARDSQAAERATRDHINELRESLFNRLSYG
jgi:DNA-binding GntR family transcriptional regulator